MKGFVPHCRDIRVGSFLAVDRTLVMHTIRAMLGEGCLRV